MAKSLQSQYFATRYVSRTVYFIFSLNTLPPVKYIPLGDVSVTNISPRYCWAKGRCAAIEALKLGDIDFDFDALKTRGCGMFNPIDRKHVVGISDDLVAGEVAEDVIVVMDLDQSRLFGPESFGSDDPVHLPTIEDEAASSQLANSDSPYLAYVEIDPGNPHSKLQHKATICRIMSTDQGGQQLSTDRLRRVCGFSRHKTMDKRNLSSGKAREVVLQEGSDSSASELHVLDPLAILLKCHGHIFVAVAQVSSLKVAGQSVESIVSCYANETDVSISVQVLQLELKRGDPRVETDSPEEDQTVIDWIWNGHIEPTPAFSNFPAELIEPLDPAQVAITRENGTDIVTYGFSNEGIKSVGTVIYERARGKTHTVFPIAQQTLSFPYRTRDSEYLDVIFRSIISTYKKRMIEGLLCFIFDSDPSQAIHTDTQLRCRQCPTVSFNQERPADLVKHISAHIMYDNEIQSGACGFCLDYGCKIFLTSQERRSAVRIDTDLSTCPNLLRLSLNTDPDKVQCTNKPIRCPLCPKSEPAQWKYHLEKHLQDQHNLEETQLLLYEHLYKISEKERAMMKAFKYRINGSRMTTKKLQRHSGLQVSDIHTVQLAVTSQPESSSTRKKPRAQTAIEDEASAHSDPDGDDINEDAEGDTAVDVSDPNQNASPSSPKEKSRVNGRTIRRTAAYKETHQDASDATCGDPECLEIQRGSRYVSGDMEKCLGPGCATWVSEIG